MAPGETGCLAVAKKVRVEAGTFRMRSADWEAASHSMPREAHIAPFDIDRHEITEADYARCVVAGGCPPLPLEGEPGLPMTGATRAEAERWCEWAGGRLPSSAEHGFAAGGEAARRYPWGDTGAVCRRAAFGLSRGPCASGARGPELAGSRPDGATTSGIHDLAGNVAEWTADDDPAREGLAPVRGGSWEDSAAHALRSWSLCWVANETRSKSIGWRCVYPVEASRERIPGQATVPSAAPATETGP